MLSAFEELDANVVPVQTVLSGELRDQAALHGVLDRLQSFGLELVEVRRVSKTAERNGRAGKRNGRAAA
jgi:hypothetical protein